MTAPIYFWHTWDIAFSLVECSLRHRMVVPGPSVLSRAKKLNKNHVTNLHQCRFGRIKVYLSDSNYKDTTKHVQQYHDLLVKLLVDEINQQVDIDLGRTAKQPHHLLIIKLGLQ